ncbi:hypothetical protein PM082_021962 [Marasmius tenuissimus]|nr:hypothetical protein PM082_021962 [Marasmius tenuissimus]
MTVRCFWEDDGVKHRTLLYSSKFSPLAHPGWRPRPPIPAISNPAASKCQPDDLGRRLVVVDQAQRPGGMSPQVSGAVTETRWMLNLSTAMCPPPTRIRRNTNGEAKIRRTGTFTEAEGSARGNVVSPQRGAWKGVSWLVGCPMLYPKSQSEAHCWVGKSASQRGASSENTAMSKESQGQRKRL